MSEEGNGDRSAILVLGMHRSGTSAVARILNLFGAALPERLMPAASSNSEGHFEPAEIVALHDALLASVGSVWSDWAAFPAEWYATPACEAYVGRLGEEIRTDYPGTGPIVLKDPRILRFIPLWLRVLEDTGLTPFAVLPFRDPYEVAASLAARNGLPMEHGYLLWLRHVLDAEFHTRGIGRTFVSYEELLTDATAGVRRLLDGLPIDRPDEADRIVEDAARTLDAKLRHNTVGEAGFAARAGMPEQVRLAHTLYERLRLDPHDALATASLDVVRADLDRYAGMARAVFRSLDVPPDPSAQDRLNASTAHTLSELGSQIAGLGSEVAGQAGGLAGQEARLARLSESTAHTLSELGGQVAGQAGGLAEQGARLAQVREIVSANQGLTHGIVERLSQVRIQVAQLKTQDASARSRLEGIDSELKALAEAFEARAQADRHRIDGELQAVGAALAAREAADRRRDQRLDRQQDLIESLFGALTDVRGRVQQRELAGPSRGWPFRRGRPGGPQEAVAALVLRSGLFDPDWYRRRYLAGSPADTDPLGHFLATGLGARHSPGPLFDVDAYAAADTAAAQSPDGPFLHYLRHRSPGDRPFLAGGPLSDG